MDPEETEKPRLNIRPRSTNLTKGMRDAEEPPDNSLIWTPRAVTVLVEIEAPRKSGEELQRSEQTGEG